MARTRLRLMLVVSVLVVGFGFATRPAEGAGDSKSVSSVQVTGGKLILRAGGEKVWFDGTYKNAKGQWVKFDDGEAVLLMSPNNTEARIQETRIEGGRVVFGTGSEEILLGNGKYEKQNPTQPRDPPPPRPQNPNSFEVRDGKVVKVWIGGSI